MPKRRITIVLPILVLFAAAAVTIKYTRYYFLPRQLGVVEKGHIYRGGEQEAGPYERIIAQDGIRSIVTLLNEEPDDPHQQIEHRLVSEHDLRLLRFPMPGDGRASFDALEATADAIADPANQPVYVHCAAGVQRTGAAVAVYRMRHCGWTLDQALAEAAANEITPRQSPELIAHLTRYYRERVLGMKHQPD